MFCVDKCQILHFSRSELLNFKQFQFLFYFHFQTISISFLSSVVLSSKLKTTYFWNRNIDL